MNVYHVYYIKSLDLNWDVPCRSRLAAAKVLLYSPGQLHENHTGVIPLLCSIFLANRGASEAAEEELQSLVSDGACLFCRDCHSFLLRLNDLACILGDRKIRSCDVEKLILFLHLRLFEKKADCIFETINLIKQLNYGLVQFKPSFVQPKL